jgi:hypothetical protein
MRYVNTPCQARSLLPPGEREFFADRQPALLERLDGSEALRKVWNLIRRRHGRHDGAIIAIKFLYRLLDAYECARGIAKPVSAASAGELVEQYRLQPVSWGDIAFRARETAERMAVMRDHAPPGLAALLDAAIAACTAVAQPASDEQRELDAWVAGYRADYAAAPREKTDESRRVWFACNLCGWFNEHLTKPAYPSAADLATVAFPNDEPMTAQAVKRAFLRSVTT